MTMRSKFDRIKAVAAFEALNHDFALTSEYTGVCVQTLQSWSQQPWWEKELLDSAPIHNKRLAQMKLMCYDAAIGYVQRLMSPEIIERMPIDKLAIAFGILVDKLLLLERSESAGGQTGDIYTRLVNQVFGSLLDDAVLQTRSS